jgi:leader peptidase (prepilin peptidase)/N-methyltransferase
VRYLLVEIITAVLFSTLYVVFGLSFDLPVALTFLCLLIVISFIDLDFRIIPDTLSVGGLILGILLSFFRPYFSWTDSLLGVLIGGGILYAIAKGYEILRKTEGMGGGDIKLLAMIGSFWGVKGVMFTLISGSFLGTLVGIPLMFIKGEGTKYAVPFGPFLSAGALLYTIAGDEVIHAFYALIAQR